MFVCIVCSYIIPQEKKRGLSISPCYVIIAYRVEFMMLNFNDTQFLVCMYECDTQFQ